MDCTICNGVKRWLKQPFNEEGSVFNWVLFTGLIIVAIYFWSRILVRIAP